MNFSLTGLRKTSKFLALKLKNERPSTLLKKVNAGVDSIYSQNRAEELRVLSGLKLNEDTFVNFFNEERYSLVRDYIYKYCKKDSKLANELYEKYYLASIDKPMAKILRKINNRFGTKVFMLDVATLKDANFIYKELEAYSNASNGKANLGKVINVSKFKDYKIFIFRNEVAAGFAVPVTSNISINGTKELQYALRHELMHLNDKQQFNILADVSVLLSNLFPKKNRPFVGQFAKAGIPDFHIPYAYKDASEFIAVAAEGDMKQYSKSFRTVARLFGMPKWGFKLQPNPIKAKDDLTGLKLVFDPESIVELIKKAPRIKVFS